MVAQRFVAGYCTQLKCSIVGPALLAGPELQFGGWSRTGPPLSLLWTRLVVRKRIRSMPLSVSQRSMTGLL